MRLATVQDDVGGQAAPRSVVLMPDGTRLEYTAVLSLLGLDGLGSSEGESRRAPPLTPNEAWNFEHLELVTPRQAELLQVWNRQDGAQKRALLKEHLQHAPLLPPVPRPRTFRDFYAFEQHVKTCRAKRKLDVAPQWYEIPVFYFSNPNSLLNPDGEVAAPRDSLELDYELELGVVIGKRGKNIASERAWEHVAGFTIINDFSARDLQRKEMAVGLGPAKGKDFATGAGPYLLTLDELRDRITPEGRVRLEMAARVNGRELSRGNAASMHFTWPRLIEQASRDAELFEGDLLGSGTVGTGCILELGPENTGGWLKPGDVVELEIERLGVLRHRVVDNGQRR